MTDPTPLHDLAAIAKAMGTSTRWVRDRLRLDGIEYTKLGNRIRMTDAQLDAFKAAYVVNATPVGGTTGRKRARA